MTGKTSKGTPRGPQRPRGGQDGQAPARGPAAVPPAVCFKEWLAEHPDCPEVLSANLRWLVEALNVYLALAFGQTYLDNAQRLDELAELMAATNQRLAEGHKETLELLRLANLNPAPPRRDQN